MTSTLVQRLVNESNGKNLAAEIYSSAGGFTVSYYINGMPSGESHYGGSFDYAKNEAQKWLDGVKVIYG